MFSRSRVRFVYFVSFGLAAVLFIFHAFAIVATGYVLVRSQNFLANALTNEGYGVVAVVATFIVLFALHMIEALAWGIFLMRVQKMKTLENAVYFAGTSLTALGYGDIVLEHPWRRLGPVLAINGILMFGCSTAFLFVVIQRVWKDV